MNINILLVEPDFPYPNKSKNRANKIHKNFVPLGLLKLGSYYKSKKHKVKLLRGNVYKSEFKDFTPDKIFITSLFTYWSDFVWNSVEYYRNLFPESEIVIGGIYVTLHHKTEDFKRKVKKFNVKWYVGLHKEAEKFLPDYSILPRVEYHVMHAMRGCIRRCKFCGTWRLEPEMTFKSKEEVINEIKTIGKNKVIFYDNNLLANPNIKNILLGLSEIKLNSKPIMFESQSGFDGRILQTNPDLAVLLKNARFKYPRIAWDNSLNDAKSIKKQIDILTKAGFSNKDIFVFMIYNFDIPFEDMVKKAEHCKKWGVQIADCRYRPLESTYDNYNPHIKNQTNNDYYIHSSAGWTDEKIKTFRKLIREQNIGLRYGKGGNYKKEYETVYSPIKSIFKKFGIVERTPKIRDFKNSNILQKRVEKMKKVINICTKKKIYLPNFKNMNNKEIDKFLINFIEKNN
jgi:hypothetical protein